LCICIVVAAMTTGDHHADAPAPAAASSSSSPSRCGNKARILLMMSMNLSYFVVELVVGSVFKSTTLVADSFHMLSDVAALIIAFVAVSVSAKKWDRSTFGFARAEVLGAFANGIFLLGLCFSIVLKAIEKFFHPETIEEPEYVFWTALVGLIINLVGMAIFSGAHHGHSHGGGGHGHSHGGGHGHNHQAAKAVRRRKAVGQDRQSRDSSSSSNDSADTWMSSASTVAANSELATRQTIQTSSFRRSAVYIMHETAGGFKRPKRPATTVALSKDKASDAGPVELTKMKATDPDAPDAAAGIESSKRKPVETVAAAATEAAAPRSGGGGDGKNLNMRGVFLHVMADTLGSITVLVSTAIIWKTEFEYKQFVDPALTLFIVVLILCSTIPLIRESSLILLQTVPSHIDLDRLKVRVKKAVPRIANIHELHVWQLVGDRIVASIHVGVRPPPPQKQGSNPEEESEPSSSSPQQTNDQMQILSDIKQAFHEAGIHSTTVQIERHDSNDNLPSCLIKCGGGGLPTKNCGRTDEEADDDDLPDCCVKNGCSCQSSCEKLTCCQEDDK